MGRDWAIPTAARFSSETNHQQLQRGSPAPLSYTQDFRRLGWWCHNYSIYIIHSLPGSSRIIESDIDVRIRRGKGNCGRSQISLNVVAVIEGSQLRKGSGLEQFSALLHVVCLPDMRSCQRVYSVQTLKRFVRDGSLIAKRYVQRMYPAKKFRTLFRWHV